MLCRTRCLTATRYVRRAGLHTKGDTPRFIRQTWTVCDTTQILNDHPLLLAKLEAPTSVFCLDVAATDRQTLYYTDDTVIWYVVTKVGHSKL